MSGHVTKLKKSNEDDEEDDCQLVPPDGGWGWMVVFGSFMIHIITDGVTYSFGVFYDEFLTYFGEGKGATAWILSILVGVTLCSGPISSAFVNKWGCRTVTIGGAILGFISMVISVYAQNVTTLYFTIGIGVGLGFGMIYLPAIVSVTTYFEKKRSLATGIAVCGSGFGTFIFAPIITKLMAEYGWRGAMLIISGILLECILFGALFRPLEPTEGIKNNGEIVNLQLKPIEAKTNINISDNNVYQLTTIAENNHESQRPQSLSFSLKRNNKPEIHNHLTVEKHNWNRMASSHPLLPQNGDFEKAKLHYGSQNLRKCGPLDKPDVFYQGSLDNINKSYKSQENLRKSSTSIRRQSDATVKVVPERRPMLCGLFPCSEEVKRTIKEMLDFSLFKDWVFILFTLSNFLTSVGFNVPYVYIVPKAKTMNITAEDASILLSIIGIANTIGRIVLGYISDKPWVNRLMVYNWCLTLCGAATAFSSFCSTFTLLALYGSVFGFTIGAYVGLTSVILVDLLGLEKLTNAFGLLLLFQGIASLIGPPIAGVLYDITKSYDPGFYLAGATIAVSGLLLFAIPFVRRKQETNNEIKGPAL